MEEAEVRYAGRKGIRHEKIRKWKRRLIKTAIGVGLIGLVSNTLSMTESVFGRRVAADISRYLPLSNLDFDNVVYPSINFKFMCSKKVTEGKISYMGVYQNTPLVFFSCHAGDITGATPEKYKIRETFDYERVFSWRR